MTIYIIAPIENTERRYTNKNISLKYNTTIRCLEAILGQLEGMGVKKRAYK